MPETELMWAAELVHYPFPRPIVLKTTDIRVESVIGGMPELSAYLEKHQNTLHRATLYAPGKWNGLCEFTSYGDEDPILML
jgi:hypothetical protein